MKNNDDITQDDKAQDNTAQTDWTSARSGMIGVLVATLLFTLWHSLLCSRGAKEKADQLLGPQRGRSFYRLFFNGQAVLTTGALVLWILRQPHRTVYQGHGIARWLGWISQASALAIALSALRDLGPRHFAGLEALQNEESHPAPEAQGPPLTKEGEIEVTGVYRWSRHPLEWLPMVLLWSSPVMKTNWLAFDILATIYSVVGALHEEKRLLHKHGAAFEKYQQQVPFVVGFPRDEKTHSGKSEANTK